MITKSSQGEKENFESFCEQNLNMLNEIVLQVVQEKIISEFWEKFGAEIEDLHIIVDEKPHYLKHKKSKGVWYCCKWEKGKTKGHQSHNIILASYGQGSQKFAIEIPMQNQACWDFYLANKHDASCLALSKKALEIRKNERIEAENKLLEKEEKHKQQVAKSVAYYDSIFGTLPSVCTGEMQSYFANKGLSEVETIALQNIRYMPNCKYGSFANNKDLADLPLGTVVLARGQKFDGTNFYQELWPKNVEIQGEKVNKGIVGSKQDGFIAINAITQNTKQIVICEGVATALSLYFYCKQDTALLAAIDCNNLKNVAKGLREYLSKNNLLSVPTLFCADDDLHNVKNDRIRKNTGLEGAKEASKLLPNSLVITPNFKAAGVDTSILPAKEIKLRYTDFNDLLALPAGLKVIGEQLKNAFELLHAKQNIAAKVATKQLRRNNINPFSSKQKASSELLQSYKKAFPQSQVEEIKFCADKLPNDFSQLCYTLTKQIEKAERRKTTIIVASPMASGKTYQMSKFFNLLRQDVRTSAIYISCLQSLCRDASNRGLGANYQDVKHARRQQNYRLDTPKYSAWCIPSLAELATNFNFPNRLYAAILDETELIANFLRSKFDNKKSALQVLDKILALSSVAVFADAYSSTKTLELVKQYRHDTDIIIVTLSQPSPKEKQVLLYPSKPAILLGIERDLEQGKKLYLAINNKKLAKDFAKTLEQKFGVNKKILLIHAENSGGKNAGNIEQKRFLDNPNNEIINYDIIITSPVINSGFSIDTIHIDSVYGVFCNTVNTSDSSSCLQQLARVRNPKSCLYHVCIVGNNLDLVTNIDDIKAMYFLRYSYDKALWKKTNGSKNFPSYSIIDEKYEYILWCVLSTYAIDKNNFFNRLIKSFALDNFDCFFTFVSNEKKDETIEKEAIARMQDAKEKVKLEHIASVQSAQKISSYEYQNLSQKTQKTQQENFEIERYDILKFYQAENATEEEQDNIIAFDIDNEGRQKIRNWKIIASPNLEAFEALYKNASSIRTEHKANLWKARLFLGSNGLLQMLGINAKLELNESLTYTKHDKAILAYLETILANYNAICKTLKLPSKKALLEQIANNPLKIVGQILSLLGLKQVRENHRSNKYKIDSQSFATWESWLVRLGYWQAGNTAYISTLPSNSKPIANIATTFAAIATLLTNKGQNGHALIAQLHNKVITVDMFLQLAINCYATNAKNGRFYQSLATKISSLINLFSKEDWEKYLNK